MWNFTVKSMPLMPAYDQWLMTKGGIEKFDRPSDGVPVVEAAHLMPKL